MNKNIVVKNRVTSTVTTDTFTLDVDGRELVYTDYLNDKGKVIDSKLEDDKGNELTEDMGPDNNAAETMDRIQTYLDEMEESK
jgi:hypothetical protein